MRVPRWTVYPAIAVIVGLVITAIPRRAPALGATSRTAPDHSRIVVLGIDGMDPEILAETIERFPERTRNFQRIIEEGGGIHSLGTSNPPQSPVAWSNFITGRNPGGHGIFDFIHRDPVTRAPAGSTTKPQHAGAIPLPGQWKFPLVDDVETNRTGESFWVTLAKHGVPADIWRMPINFPVDPAKGLSFPGMMTPALDSAYGLYTFYTTDPPLDRNVSQGRVVPVRRFGDGISTRLEGPPNAFKDGDPPATVEVKVFLDDEANAAAIEVGDEVVVLAPGQWSDFVRVSFELLPWGLTSVSGVVRFYLRRIAPEFEMYASPVNIDPLAPAMPVSEPVEASADLAKAVGIYYTQGMAEEVNALKERILDDEEFMDQAELIYESRLRMLDYALDRYFDNGDGGFFFFYFSTVDLCSHMMWRHFDANHPHHDPAFADRSSTAWSGREGSKWKDVVYDLYLRMDPVLGRLRERVGDDALVLVMSDHGFASYERKFNLNTWLYDNEYLVLKKGQEKETPRDHETYQHVYLHDAADWTRTRAYGIGFNGLYLNLAGRERDNPRTKDVDEAGIVQRGAEADALLDEIAEKLEALRDEDGTQIVTWAAKAKDVYQGERLAEAPDLLVGYNVGYGNSDGASQGRIPHFVLEDNLGGTFNGSHLMDPRVVAGTLLSSTPVPAGHWKLEDLTVEILKRYGITPGADLAGRPIF